MKILHLILLGLSVLLPLAAQDSRPVSDPEIRRLLGSPYEAERERGIAALTALFAADDAASSVWLADSTTLVRVGALRALVRSAADFEALRAPLACLRQIDDEEQRVLVAGEVLEALLDRWNGEAAILDATAGADPALRRAARGVVRLRLLDLVGRGTLMTEHRVLAAFSALGPLGADLLAEIAADESGYSASRVLALGALARTDARSTFVDDEGRPAVIWSTLLDDESDALKLAVLYGVAFRGIDSRPMMAELARYVRQDAFNEYTIEAALYALHARGAGKLAGLEAEVDLCLDEFLDSLYSQRVRFHAAQLLAARGPAGRTETALGMIAEDPCFSSYWLLAAVLNGLESLPEADRAAVEKRGLELALREQGPPQLRALAVWYLRKIGRELPEGLDVAALMKEVRDSIAVVVTRDRDPDYYAMRSGLEILAYLGDRELIPIIREHLDHESEAVRMVAALAAGQGGFSELRDDVARLLEKPFEYAAYGAARALDTLGDPRGPRWLADYLASGNACLMPGALDALRRHRGKVLEATVPESSSDWRRRSRLWRHELEAKAED